MDKKYYKFTKRQQVKFTPNFWDIIMLFLILGLFAMTVIATNNMTIPYSLGENIKITLSPLKLPFYAFYSILRMAIALFISLIVSLFIGRLCAKSQMAEKLVIPLIDILQSIPILGFQAISVIPFIYLFPTTRFGPECAAIFALFTSLAWNMILSVYQSIKSLPHDLEEAADIMRLSKWQRAFKIEFPFAVPNLIWNMMISVSSGWFFVVACETVLVANQKITLPGIGSYIYLAIADQNLTAIFYAIFTMLIVILLYDQLLFRPLVWWSEKFKLDADDEYTFYDTPWVYNLFQKTILIKSLKNKLSTFIDLIKSYIYKHYKKINYTTLDISTSQTKTIPPALIYSILIILLGISVYFFIDFITDNLSTKEILYVVYLGAITASKVFILIILCSIIWVPVGVYIGLNPKLTKIVQPLIQFLAAFPANLIFPLIVMLIVKFNLNVNIWTSPLMILGTQWYILFNIIAGMTSIPKELKYAIQNYQIKGKLWWTRFALPAIFPYYVTGAMAAAGGAWNASIVAEVVEWGNTKLVATGLGAYIAQYTATGNMPRVALGIIVMSLYVIILNKLIWQRLYKKTTNYYSFNT
tara:strand:+ start:27647 stop:29398 length:1752 start_codon:yes stop_codon:yes gene_type:complete